MNVAFFVILVIIIGVVWAGLHYGAKVDVPVNTAGIFVVSLLVGGLLSVIFFSAGEVRGLVRGWAFVGGLACGRYVSAKAGKILGALSGLGLAFGAYTLTGLL